MSTQHASFQTPQEYLALERSSESKHEYFGGEIFAMGGASRSHNLVVANLLRDIGSQLKGKTCRIYPSDLRVKVNTTGLYTYPDVVIVCGEEQFDDEHQDTLLNPTIVIEVLSDSTEAYDRGKKFGHYRQLESLREYVLVAQSQALVEHFARQSEGEWLLTEANTLDAEIQLPACGCKLTLAEVYDKVDFPVEEEEAANGTPRELRK